MVWDSRSELLMQIAGGQGLAEKEFYSVGATVQLSPQRICANTLRCQRGPKGDAMTQPIPGDRISLTVYLSPDVAKRLKAAAEAQKRAAADLVADLLDRHLPRPQTGGQPKSSIPYS
jgi:hypothetical protein